MIESVPYTTGAPIAVQGMYSDVPMTDYHGALLCDGPSISSSGIRKIIINSPAHYWGECPMNANAVEPKEKEAYIIGRAAHHLLLGQKDFSKLFVIRPDEIGGRAWHGNRSDCKEWALCRQEEGLTILKGEQAEAIKGMSESLARHPLYEAGILNGMIEQTMVFRHKATGIWMKSRPDDISTDSGDYADLKTTPSVDKEALRRTIGDCGYQIQGAVVGTAAREVLKIEMNSFSLVFVEKTHPYCVRVCALYHEDIDLGYEQIEASMEIFAECLAKNKWPGPGGEQSDAEYIHLHPWRRKQIRDQLDVLKAARSLDASSIVHDATGGEQYV